MLEIESETHNLYIAFLALDKLTRPKITVYDNMNTMQELVERSQGSLNKIILRVDVLKRNMNKLMKTISLHVALNPEANTDFQSILMGIKDRVDHYLEKLKKANIKIHKITESIAKVRSSLAKVK